MIFGFNCLCVNGMSIHTGVSYNQRVVSSDIQVLYPLPVGSAELNLGFLIYEIKLCNPIFDLTDKLIELHTGTCYSSCKIRSTLNVSRN
jgi:hypothetical protein